MKNHRYSRSLTPSDPKSVPDFLNREHQKLETTIDAILADRETDSGAIEVLQADVAAAQSDITGLQTDLNAAEADIAALQAFTGNIQAAIANDASGAANQATVNAILAALRAYGIISP